MPQTAQTLDAAAVRSWCVRALHALGREREEIDAINVYPIADGDTGTNLYLTLESAVQAVEEVFAADVAVAADTAADGEAAGPDAAAVIRAMAYGALIGARGNSGTILSQLLRGMTPVLADGRDGDHLARALAAAAEAARQAVAHPVEGTILSVASAAAGACAARCALIASWSRRSAYPASTQGRRAWWDSTSAIVMASLPSAANAGQ